MWASINLCTNAQKTPKSTLANWRDLAKHIQLQPIHESKDWQPWVELHLPAFLDRGADLGTVIMLAKGNPGVVANFCNSIVSS